MLIAQAENVGHSDLPPLMHPYTKFDDPTMYSCRDINSDVNLNVDPNRDGNGNGDAYAGGTP